MIKPCSPPPPQGPRIYDRPICLEKGVLLEALGGWCSQEKQRAVKLTRFLPKHPAKWHVLLTPEFYWIKCKAEALTTPSAPLLCWVALTEAAHRASGILSCRVGLTVQKSLKIFKECQHHGRDAWNRKIYTQRNIANRAWSSPMAAETKDPKLGELKQQTFILPQFWRPEVWNQFLWPHIGCQQGQIPWGTHWGDCSFPLPASGGC